MADDVKTNAPETKENQNAKPEKENKEEKEDDTKVYGEDNGDGKDGDGEKGSEDSEIDEEEQGQKAVEGIAHGLNNVKDSMQAAIKIFKKIWQLFCKLAEMGWVGWIIIAIIIVVIIILAIVFSFSDNNSNEESFRSLYDTQDSLAEYQYNQREEYKEVMQTVQDELKEDMSDEDYEQLKNDISAYSIVVSDYGDNLVSMYDTTAGYQMLNQDGTVLQILEELSYAYKFTEWDPDYDTGRTKEAEIEALEEAINEQEALPKSERDWSELKLRNKTEDLAELKDEYAELEYYAQRYIELNSLIYERIKKDFINSSKKSKVHPDGNEVSDVVVSYYKDKYGVEYDNTTQEYSDMVTYMKEKWDIDFDGIKEELNYYHTMMHRDFSMEKTKDCGTSLDKVLSFIDDPEFEKGDIKEEDEGMDLAEVEYPFRVRLELVHHEITLNLIYTDNILNTIFTRAECFPRLTKSLGSHMPLFEYITYDSSVIDKTFYDYELFDSSYFDDEGNYIFNNDFQSKLKNYTENTEADLNFSPVEEQAEKEYQLARYKLQLEEQNKSDNPDGILIEELNELIEALEEEIAENPSSEEMMEDYKEGFTQFLRNKTSGEEKYRPYDAHNHNIITDTLELNDEGEEDYTYYINHYDIPVDSYNDSFTITETMTISATGSGERSNGTWKTSTKQLSDTTKKYSVTVKSQSEQTSIKPLKVRSLLNNADYTYTKTETKKTNEEIKTLLDEKRKDTSWEEREVTFTAEDGTKTKATEYRKITEVTFSNSGKVEGAVDPWDTNEAMLLDTSTYKTDFYGQTEKITTEDSEETTPGEVGGIGGISGGSDTPSRSGITFTAGHCDITYYSQKDYSEMYGKSTTIAEAGCGPACMAMIYDSLTNSKKGVVWMANWCVENSYCNESQQSDGTWKGNGTYHSLFTNGATQLGLKTNTISASDMQGLADALGRNHAVVMLCQAGDFTDNGHFIVLTGIDEDGNITINDPNSESKSNVTWTIERIMSNANVNATYWEIYK